MEHAVDPQPLLEWLIEKYRDFGANVELITDSSQEGAQFVRGFGGIGGILRYKVEFTAFASSTEEEGEFYSDDEEL